MKKKYVITASIIILIIIIITAIYIIHGKSNNMQKDESVIYNDMDNTMKELSLFINSSDDLKSDTNAYENQYVYELRKIFDKLNDNTNLLLDTMLDNADKDIIQLLNAIKNDENELFKIIDEAYNNARSSQYKVSYTALKKYIKLQNETIYKLAEVYNKNKSLTYDEYYEMLHETHGALSPEETNGINFLTAVDRLIEENK